MPVISEQFINTDIELMEFYWKVVRKLVLLITFYTYMFMSTKFNAYGYHYLPVD